MALALLQSSPITRNVFSKMGSFDVSISAKTVHTSVIALIILDKPHQEFVFESFVFEKFVFEPQQIEFYKSFQDLTLFLKVFINTKHNVKILKIDSVLDNFHMIRFVSSIDIKPIGVYQT